MKYIYLLSIGIVLGTLILPSCKKKEGCTNPSATNYDPNAEKDDGSCVLSPTLIYGCTDPTAFNYNSNANTDDGSCIPIILGCTDSLSVSYNPNANTEDSTCIYPSPVKKALVFKQGATWSPYDATWGMQYTNDIMNDHSNSFVISLHYADTFSCNVGDEIMTILNYLSYPHFFVGTTSINNSYTLLSTAVNDELNKPVEVAMAIADSVVGSDLFVGVHSQWMDTNNAGEFYLAIYILEDGQIAEQAFPAPTPIDSNYVHNNVLRKEVNDLPFGSPITPIDNNKIVHYQITLDNSWVASNCYPVAVIWEKVGTDYEFVNLVL